jgi:predicted TIM-barrel fold metal-dependent hydrolase
MTPSIIDCHTHCYPAESIADPRTWAQKNNEPHWANLVAPLDRPSIQAWATPQSMLHDMDTAGIEKTVLLGWYWEHAVNCRTHNEAIANWITHAPDRFIGFAAIHPAADVTEQLQHAADLGLQGVGELHSGVQKFNAQSPGWLELAHFCQSHNWPVNLHVTEAAGRTHPDAVSTPLQSICDLAASAPELKIILAHWGGGLPLLESNPYLQKILKNVSYDCSASPLLYQPEIFRRVIDCVGSHKVCFGSDYPLRLFPRTHKEADFTTYLHYIREEAQLTTSEFNALTRDNFLRLFK